MKNINLTKATNSNKLLLALTELAETTFDHLDAFLLSGGSAKILGQNIGMLNREYHSAFQGLCRNGYIREVNEDQFLITPKARVKIKIIRIGNSDWTKGEWDGHWKIVAFDIPEAKKRERNIFRSVIKRKGFIGIQNSVFIAPFADFEALAELRNELNIEKFVSFFTAESYRTDDDSRLKERFGIK